MSDEGSKTERFWPGEKCDLCDKLATLHMTDPDPKTGRPKTIHLCPEHSPFVWGANPKRPCDPSR